MASLATCLGLQSFAPEDIAEIQGFIRSSGGDAAAGVQAYLDSLTADMQELADQVARSVGMMEGGIVPPEGASGEIVALVRKINEGVSAQDLLDDPAMSDALDKMLAIPETMSEQIADDVEARVAFVADRTYTDPVTGESIEGGAALLRRVWEESAQWADGVRSEKQIIVLIGAPAAGKSTLAERLARDTGSRILDGDEIKKFIPEYQNGIGAAAVHEESSALLKMLMPSALETGDNLILPKVGDNAAKLRGQIADLRSAGYTVDVVAMEVDPEEAFRRMVGRFVNTGRLIPPKYALDAATRPPQTYAELRAKGEADGFAKINNNQPFGQAPTIIEDRTVGQVVGGLRQSDSLAGRDGGLPQVSRAAGAEAQGLTLFQAPAGGLRFDRGGYDWRADPAPGADKRIATRFPQQVQSTEDPVADPTLQIDTTTMQAAPAPFAHNMSLIPEYPSMEDISGDPDEIARQFTERVKDNLVWLYNAAPEILRTRGWHWYDGARRIAETWSDRYGLPVQSVAGALAALSPQKDWFQNVSLAERVLDVMVFGRDIRWSAAMTRKWNSIPALSKYGDTLKAIKGKTVQQLIDEGAPAPHIAAWVRTYDETFNDRSYSVLTPEGDLLPATGNKVAWGSLAEIAKAVKVILDPDMASVSVEMGGNHKVRSFYNNIVTPNALAGDVTIDTHAVAAALLRPLSQSSPEVSHAFGTGLEAKKQPEGYRGAKGAGIAGAKGLYGVYADAYRAAAQAVGILPRQLQSITWEAVRLLFPDAQKRGKMGRSVEAIWRGEGTVEEKRDAAFASAGGIGDPAWAGAGSGATDPRQQATYQGELSSRGRTDGGRDDAGAGDGAAGAVPDNGGREAAAGGGTDAVDAAGVRGASGRASFRGREAQPIAVHGEKEGRPVYEIDDPALFKDLISEAQKDLGPVGPQVTVYDDYAGKRLFLFDQGLSGFALDGDDIISVFSVPGTPPKAAQRVMEVAVAEGGRRLDAFDTFLPRIYAKAGFRAVAALPFSREFAPEGWDYDFMAENFGDPEPDVLFMVYDPANASPETDNVVAEYDDGLAAQKAALPRTLHQSAPGTPAFDAWFGDSVVVDGSGQPLVVYRGEHGRRGDEDFQSRAGSLTFGSASAASFYAESPNDYNDVAQQPVVMPVYLSVQNPIFHQNDPFADVSEISDKLGPEGVDFVFEHFGDWMENTNRWEDKLSHEFGSPQEMYREAPERAIAELYFDAYPLLDDPRFVAMAVAAGYDGAITDGSGETGGENEYRVFSPSQIKSVFNQGTFDPNDPRILMQSAPGAPAFDAWFGDSKVVDEDGQPRVMYHGTTADISEFKIPSFFSSDSDEASAYTFWSPLKWREKVLKNPKYNLIDGTEFAGRLPYVGIIGDIPNTGEVWATDDGVARRNEGGTIDLFPDLVVVYGTYDGSLDTIEVVEGDARAAAEETVKEYLEAIDRRAGPDEGVGGNVLPVYLSVKNPKVMGALEANRLGKRLGVMSDEEVATMIEELKAEGYDGIVTRSDEGAMFPELFDGKIPDHVIPFYPEQIKSVFNQGTFDPNDPRILMQGQDGPRGSIEIPGGGVDSGTTIIRLMEGNDLSTFLHESAHFFLEVMNTLSREGPELDGDLAAIRKFVGAKDGQDGFTTEQHETFARGFEAYLMEGKAPSLELADAFSLIKSWILNVYRKIAGGTGVKLTAEMRDVFDRMLATEDAIAEARAEMSMSALFSKKPPAMTDTDWGVYQRMARRSSEQAEQRLLKRMMAKITREKKAWFKEERQAVREQVETRINEMPEYRLIEALGNGRWLGDEDTEVPDFRIDRDTLVAEFGQDTLAEIDRSQVGGRQAIYGPNGSTPSEVAEFFGFRNAREMVDALKAAGKRDAVVDAEADRIMDERYGDVMNDGTIEEEAMLAVHSEQQSAATVVEARELARQMGRDATGMTSRVYAARAKDMIGRMTVAQASKPAQFLAAERRAAREAQQAFARVARGGDEMALSDAYRAKERQVLNQHLYTAARQVQEEVTKGREKMMRYRKADVRQKLEGGYIEQIDALLEQHDFRKKGPGEVGRAQSLAAFVDQMIADGREAELSIDQRLIDEARRVHYTQLSVSELRGLFDTIANIDRLGRFKKKLIEKARKRDLDQSAQRVVAAVRASQKAKPDDGKPRRALQALNLLSKPDTIMIRMDGGDEFGPFWEEIKRSIDEGSAVEQEMQVDMARKLGDLFDKHYNHSEVRAQLKPVPVPGVENQWTKQEIIALALNLGNRDGYQRATDPNVAENRRLTDADIDALLGTLTENDWRFIQEMWDLINTYWPQLAEVQKRRTDVTPKKIEAEMMYRGAPSFVTGGYYPIKYDPTKGKAAARDEETATDKYMTAGHGSTAAVANGMTKQREKTSGGRTLLYDLSVPMTHMRETIRFIALSEAVDATHRVLNHPDVFDAMQETGNSDTHKTLNLWLRDTAEGPKFNNDLGNTLARVVKNNFTMSRLAFNLKTVILQATGLSQSAVVIGKRNMLRGMRLYWMKPAATIVDTLALSPKMRERQSTFQKDIYDFTNDVQATSPYVNAFRKSKQAVGKAGFWPIVAMQFYVVDMPTWVGAYTKYIEEYDGDVTRAALAADKMVERAQDTGVLPDRAAVERGTLSKNTQQADIVRVFTTLGGYMLTKLNRGYVRALQGKAKIQSAESRIEQIAEATGMAFDLTLLFAAEAVMMGLLWELLDDDDETDDLNEFLLREIGTGVVAGVPLVRDAAGAFNGYGGGGVYGAVTEVPANFYVQALQGENDRALRRSISDVVGIVTGLPTTAALRAIEAAADSDVSISEALLGINPLNRR